MKTLTLVATEHEQSDAIRKKSRNSPRGVLFEQVLNSDILDSNFLKNAPESRTVIYRRTPVFLAQVLEAYFRRESYDAVISWAEKLGLSFASLLKLTGTRVPHVALFSWISKTKKAALLKRVHSHIDRLVLWSSVQRDFAIQKLGIPPSKITFVRWPVDQRFWQPVRSSTEMISSAGREMRDYVTLVKALTGLDIPCHVAAYNAANKKDAWMTQIRQNELPSNITWGSKNPLDLRNMYARSRFVVIPLIPTDTDNGVNCILEAMAMGKAVICSRTHGQRDVLQDGRNGILVPPHDPRALREAILHLWNNPEIADRLGNEGRKHVEKFHTIDRFVLDVKSSVQMAIEQYKPAHTRSSEVSYAD